MKELAGNLIVEDGKILLLYREDEEHWEVPGGKVEEDESPTEAAVREAEEEIGVEVSLEKPFYTGEFQHNDDLFLWNGYIAEIEEGEPEITEDNFGKLEWFEGSELDNLELAPNLKMILPALRKL
ncbi:NUDIX domain-containing protein [Candidatus Nanohalobium constans]|uniref:8-oxo-dGTP diphosphatase n=1 Tax=Candidatus Nanohalobium constans TaxID=2565781 RepID=A0A5Q0UH54_9ARCH|nr:NUDIX domain-containing protein [Candidatus Nanohalobium constans]QGA80916.1 8-oxo-dGTP diphosphatase [Candidatus Nanohalobium constans]